MVDMTDCIRSLEMDHALDTTPMYSVTEAAEMTDISGYTLRYYDNQGLFPFLVKTASGKRLFSEADLQWAKLLECLRRAGMPIREMQHYVDLVNCGEDTLSERYEILKKREADILEQIEEKKKSLELLRFKIRYYEKQMDAQMDVQTDAP